MIHIFALLVYYLLNSMHFEELHFTQCKAPFNFSSVPNQLFVHFLINFSIFVRLSWILKLALLALQPRLFRSVGRCHHHSTMFITASLLVPLLRFDLGDQQRGLGAFLGRLDLLRIALFLLLLRLVHLACMLR